MLDAAARAGLAVPGDLSVIGFDDIELAAAIGLTTVRQPLRESGRLGARLLLSALDGDEALRTGAAAGCRTSRSVRSPHRFRNRWRNSTHRALTRGRRVDSLEPVPLLCPTPRERSRTSAR